MGVYDRQIKNAKAAIAKKGEAVEWVKKLGTDPASPSYRPQPISGLPDKYDVSIAFFSPSDLGKGSDEFLTRAVNSEVPTSYEVGLLAGDLAFTPEETDSIIRSDGSTVKVEKLDRLAPNGQPVLYYVWIIS